MKKTISEQNQIKKNWFKKHPFISIFLVFLIVIFILGSNNQQSTLNKANIVSNQSIEPTSRSVINVSVEKFISDFDKNQLAAEEKYSGKLIKFTGYIKNISEDITGSPFLSLQPTDEQYYLGTSIKCNFKDKSQLTSLENGQSITVTGEVDSQSLGIIVLKNCNISG